MAYLMRHSNGTYYLRKVFVKDGIRKEVRRSLHTKSLQEANTRIHQSYIDLIASPPMFNTLEDAIERYLKAIEGSIAPKTLQGKKSLLNRFLLYTGNKDIGFITQKDIVAFKEHLEQQKKSPTTVILYLKDLQGFFRHQNIDVDIRSLVKSKSTRRQDSYRDALTSSEVNTVIDHLSDNYSKKDSKYWIVLIGVYSGMRLGEITQLYTDNIIEYQGIWCFYVTSDRDDQRVKNLSSERIIPIAQYLLDVGFLTYVQSQHEGSRLLEGEPVSTRLFPDLKYSKLHGYSGGVSRWFSKLLKDLGIKNDTNRVSAHSLRHFGATCLKHKNIPENIVSEILGHSSGDSITYQRYAKGFGVKKLKEVIDLVNTKEDKFIK